MIRPFDFSWLPNLPPQARQWFQELYDQIKSLFSITNACFGPGQTWQNVTASRAIGSTYTNTTGRPIEVKISVGAIAPYIDVFEYINGQSVSYSMEIASGGGYITCNMIVPPGSSYGITTTYATLRSWWELR